MTWNYQECSQWAVLHALDLCYRKYTVMDMISDWEAWRHIEQLASKKDVHIGRVSCLTLLPSILSNNVLNQVQSRSCASAGQCFEPPITPAISSAAARCLLWSVSSSKLKRDGRRCSKGSSSRSWTVGKNQKVPRKKYYVAIHIDFTHEMLSCVAESAWFSSAKKPLKAFQNASVRAISRTISFMPLLSGSQGSKEDFPGGAARYSSTCAGQANQPTRALSCKVLVAAC